MAMEDSSRSNSMSDLASSNHIRNGNFLCGVVEGFYGKPWTPDQRKDLFAKISKFGINSYLYAPKDDCKHRAFWRDLYSVEEAEQLSGLISCAKANNVTFYYALSPGLDITYSSAKDLTFLKRKLEQVSQFGCTAFSLLFDDIEPDMCEADKEVFHSFANAQVSVTNEVFLHLGQPQFLFCPTEYCASRAIPNVQNSEYLNTIGNKLLPGIDIMWTGSKVISKIITVESITELTQVLHRPPVIWDNIHANDYDQKRLYLGPFTGRSPDLIPHLRGLLTNPNCEYEANFIPIHTLAQWSRCSVDGKRDLSVNNAITADIKLETERDNGSIEDIPSQITSVSYHPKNALKVAMKDWLLEFYRPKSFHGKVIAPSLQESLIPMINSCISVTTTTVTSSSVGVGSMPLEVTESSNFQSVMTPLVTPVMNSLISPSDTASSSDEPMDCMSSPCSSPKQSNYKSEKNSLNNGSSGDGTRSTDEDCKMQTDAGLADAKNSGESCDGCTLEENDKLMADDITLLVDLFHLPFEHGSQGLQILQDFNWLINNAHVVVTNKTSNAMSNPAEVQEWQDKAVKFNLLTQTICRLYKRLVQCPNRSLRHDLYTYLWEMQGIVCLLNSFVKWLGLGKIPSKVSDFLQAPYTWFSQGWKEAFMSGDQEPWVFRGGLIAELQRLLPLENVADLYMWKIPEAPSTKNFLIRPYEESDRNTVYSICLQTCDDGLDGTEVFPGQPDLIGDKLVGCYLDLNPEFCFVMEEDGEMHGYALSSLDAKQFYNKISASYMETLSAKYPLQAKDSQDLPTPAQEIIAGFHDYKTNFPETVYKTHPSIIRLNSLPNVLDLSLVKRLLACSLAALKLNGSYGVFCEINVGDKNMVDLYSKLGFRELSVGKDVRDLMYFGRTF